MYYFCNEIMRYLLSILISLSVLAGSVGFNLLNSECSVCGSGQGCECCGSCGARDDVAVEVLSCCSLDLAEPETNGASCTVSGNCCSFKLVKLEVPVVLVSQPEKITVPEKDITQDLLFAQLERLSEIFLPSAKYRYKPPPIVRPGLDLHCIFLC